MTNLTDPQNRNNAAIDASRDASKIAIAVLMEAAATTGPIPRSTIYMLTGMNLQIATAIETVMVKSGWITTTADTIRATRKGRELVQSAQSEVANS